MRNETESTIISNLEYELSLAEDIKLARICSKFKQWEIVNHEKPSRLFCTLAKAAKKNISVDILKDHANKVNNVAPPFKSVNDRNIDSIGFYNKIYEQPPPREIDIKDFLGETLYNSDSFRNKRLDQLTKDYLESDLTLNELKTALNKANTDSAAGADGIGYRFYKTYFEYFGLPILNCFTFMTESSKLLPPFNVVKIQIIPKKNDLSSISNWRPISLCASAYKIFSSAIAARLSEVIDKCIGNTQKAYSKSKNIAESVTNILNHLENSKKLGYPTATLAIDFAKAFDKVSHSYILHTLEQFNFGPKFCNIIKTVLTNRIAFISNFNCPEMLVYVMSGIPQGDAISGFLFILCIEVLLLKIQSEVELLSPAYPELTTVNEHQIRLNSGGKPTEPLTNHDVNSCSGYADDITLFFSPSIEAFNFIIKTLDEFKKLSNLASNLSKTNVVFSEPPPQDIIDFVTEVGFNIKESTEILGFTFNNSLTNLDINISNALMKIEQQINFWSRFNLSLIGRVNVANTYLYSQIAYFLAVIKPTEPQCILFDTMIEDFVKDKLKISATFIHKHRKGGGLGLPKCEDFSTCLLLNCFRRSLFSNDSWSYPIRRAIVDNDHLVTSNSFDFLNNFPHSKTINEAFESFSLAYYSCTKNILSTPLNYTNFFRKITNIVGIQLNNYNNLIINVNRAGNIDKFPLLGAIISRQTGSVVPRQTCDDILGISITAPQHTCLNFLVKSIIKKFPLCLLSSINPIKDLFKKNGKGSKKYKDQLLDQDASAIFNGWKSRLDRAGTPPGTRCTKREKSLIKAFGINSLQNCVREFIFNFKNGLLYSNSQKAHFLPNYSPQCNLCFLKKFLPPPKESLEHIFFHCPVVAELRSCFNTKFPSLADANNRETIFCGSDLDNPINRERCTLTSILINYSIYKNRNVEADILNIGFLIDYIINVLRGIKSNICMNSIYETLSNINENLTLDNDNNGNL